MTQEILSRRKLLASTALLAAGLGLGSSPSNAQSVAESSEQNISVYVPEMSDFPFEVVHTEAEWREHLDNDDLSYEVLRQAKTEKPGTTDLWLFAFPGAYLCRGCDLPIYEGRWFQELDKGWVFFHHAMPHSVMFSLDGPVPQYGQSGMALDEGNAIGEVHCRRCGSHLGHHLKVSGMFLHCINGTALKLDTA